MQKKSKMTTLVTFFYFQTLELVWKIKKKHQILTRCSILCITSTEKNRRSNILYSPGDNTEKISAHQFFAKQKIDVPKADKMAAGVLESAVSPPVGVWGQSPRNVLILFRLKHGKTSIVQVKIW